MQQVGAGGGGIGGRSDSRMGVGLAVGLQPHCSVIYLFIGIKEQKKLKITYLDKHMEDVYNGC